MTNIGDRAFYGCTGLTSITIPNSVTKIDSQAFDGCTSLVSVTIGSGVKSIGNKAFYGCMDLERVYSFIKVPFAIDASVFGNSDSYQENVLYSIVTLYVPTGRKKIYEATEAWNLFSNIMELDPSGIDAVGTDTKMETARYNLNGSRIAQPQRSLNIIRMSDGTVRKTIVK